jgi:hypothetical protein
MTIQLSWSLQTLIVIQITPIRPIRFWKIWNDRHLPRDHRQELPRRVPRDALQEPVRFRRAPPSPRTVRRANHILRGRHCAQVHAHQRSRVGEHQRGHRGLAARHFTRPSGSVHQLGHHAGHHDKSRSKDHALKARRSQDMRMHQGSAEGSREVLHMHHEWALHDVGAPI